MAVDNLSQWIEEDLGDQLRGETLEHMHLQLISRLRRDRAFDGIDIFVLTTSKLDEDHLAAQELGVAGFVTKDYAEDAYDTLVEALRRDGDVPEDALT